VDRTYHDITTLLLFLASRNRRRFEGLVGEGDLAMVDHRGPDVCLDSLSILPESLDEGLDVSQCPLADDVLEGHHSGVCLL